MRKEDLISSVQDDLQGFFLEFTITFSVFPAIDPFIYTFSFMELAMKVELFRQHCKRMIKFSSYRDSAFFAKLKGAKSKRGTGYLS